MISAKAFWDKTAAKYAKSSIADMASYEKKLAKTQEYFTPQDSILEFGCGTGSTALIHAPFVEHIHAIDISQNMISIAQEKANEQSINNVTFEQGTLESLDVMTKVYDGVLGLNILHLLDDIDGAIEKVYKLTKPGGFFISSTALLTDMKWYVKLIIPIMQFLRLAPYVCAINKEQLIDSLKKAGFNIDYQWQPNSVSIFIVAKKPIENPQ